MTESATAAVPAEAPPKGVLSRMVGVIFSPRATFADVAKHPRSLAVLAICAVIIAGSLFALFRTEVGQQAWLDQQVQASQAFGRQIPDQQYQGMERIAPFIGYVVGIGYLIVIPIVVAIVSGILLGIFNAFMGGDATYKQVFAIVTHAGVISTIQVLFGMPLNYFRQTLSPATTLGAFVPFLDETSLVARFLGAIDLFYVWWMIVLAIGLAVLYRRKTGPIATTFLTLYGVIALAYAVVRSAFS
jgi:hypothetical protein